MLGGGANADHAHMNGPVVSITQPAGTGATVRRLVLVPAGGRSAGAVRRFRLARLRLEDREVARTERFAHLTRVHD
jgi:hypothetical protein